MSFPLLRYLPWDTARNRAGRPFVRKSFRPRLEPLEYRALPSTYTVFNTEDSGDGSLRDAVLAAEANPGADLIEFAPQVHGTITLITGELLISSDLTIDGPGANRVKVSGNDASRIFNVVGGADETTAIAVNISDLTITRGRSDGIGGGILNSDFSNLTLNGVVLSNNVAVGVSGPNADGGGIYSAGEGSSLSIIDSRITGNTADGRNVVRAVGGGLSIDSGSLTVINSTIADNKSFGGAEGVALGGGLRLRSVSGTITGSVIRDNRAIGGPDGGEAFGGGIGLRFADLIIQESTLSGNEALGGDGGVYGLASGGAIESLGGSLSIFDSRLVKNRAVAGSGGVNAGDDFSVGTAWGGAIFNYGLVEISNSIVRDNEAVGGNNAAHTDAPNTADVGAAHGGAIANAAGGEVVVRNSTIIHNRAIGGNGNTGSGTVAFVGTATGGGIDNSLDPFLFGEPDHLPPKFTIINSTLKGNKAIGGNNNIGDGVDVFAGAGLGGGVANYLGALTSITDSLLTGNRAIGGTGGLGAGGGVFNGIGEVAAASGTLAAPTVVEITGSTLKHNIARGGPGNPGGNGFGGGVYNGVTAELSLVDSIITKNKALRGGSGGQGIGGGIYNLGAFDVDALTFIGNNVATTSHKDIFG